MLRELAGNNHADALAGATPYCRLFGLAQGGIGLADMALAAAASLARGETDKAHAGRIARARYFAENLATASSGLLQTILSGAGSVDETALAMAG
jgi:butyryl-CoA dehydrogenase